MPTALSDLQLSLKGRHFSGPGWKGIAAGRREEQEKAHFHLELLFISLLATKQAIPVLTRIAPWEPRWQRHKYIVYPWSWKKQKESLQRNKKRDHLFSSTRWKYVFLSQLFTEIWGLQAADSRAQEEQQQLLQWKDQCAWALDFCQAENIIILRSSPAPKTAAHLTLYAVPCLFHVFIQRHNGIVRVIIKATKSLNFPTNL